MHSLSRQVFQDLSCDELQDMVDSDKLRGSQKFTFFILTVIFTKVALCSWLTVYSMAALPGPKLYNGMICGLAEAVSSLVTGLMMKYMTDAQTSFIMAIMNVVFCILYRLLGAGDGGIPAMICLWLGILGVGGLVNSAYVLIEMRVPPQRQGSSLVIILTLSIFMSGTAPNLAYLPQPFPLYIQLALMVGIMVALFYLPPGGQYLPHIQKDEANADNSITSVHMINSIHKRLHNSVQIPIFGPAPNFLTTY